MPVRNAREWDVLPAMQMAESYFEEAGEHLGIPYDKELAVHRLIDAIRSEDQCLLVYVHEGRVVGLLWGLYGPIVPWSKACIAQDVVLYLQPEHRGRLGGYLLIQKFLEWALHKGANECRLSIGSGLHEDKTSNAYKKMGFHYIGSQYRRNLNVPITQHP